MFKDISLLKYKVARWIERYPLLSIFIYNNSQIIMEFQRFVKTQKNIQLLMLELILEFLHWVLEN